MFPKKEKNKKDMTLSLSYIVLVPIENCLPVFVM
uniref:Uncharacterized protein n=1 Tax=Arundo donax TaxID=35708 RepID=A0A0A8ZIG7_ARUDO